MKMPPGWERDNLDLGNWLADMQIQSSWNPNIDHTQKGHYKLGRFRLDIMKEMAEFIDSYIQNGKYNSTEELATAAKILLKFKDWQ